MDKIPSRCILRIRSFMGRRSCWELLRKGELNEWRLLHMSSMDRIPTETVRRSALRWSMNREHLRGVLWIANFLDVFFE